MLFFIASFIINIGDTKMKKTVEIVYRTILIVVVVVWIGLIFIEYTRFQKDLPMVVLIKEETKTYDDGYVVINYGLGYKTITYERSSIKGKEFGHIFIKVREKLPKM